MAERPGPAPKGTMVDEGPGTRPNHRKWRFSVSTGVKRPNGGYFRSTRRFEGTKKEASKALAAFLLEVAGARTEHATKVAGNTVGDLLDRWLTHAEHTELRAANTIRGYRQKVEKDIKPIIGHIKVSELTVANVDDFYTSLTARGLAAKTVRQDHAILRRALRQARTWGMVDRNVAELAAKPRVDQFEIDVPSITQVRALIDAADEIGPQARLLLELAAGTGARRSEMCGLAWADLNLDACAMTIRSTTTLIKGQLFIQTTKTRKSRTISIDPDIVELLTAWKIQQTAELHGECDWVFSQPSGQPWAPDWASHRFDQARAIAALKDPSIAKIRLHDLRHWHATVLLDAGIPLADVAARLGHTSPTTTLMVYAGRTVARDAEAARIIRALRKG